MIRAVLFDFDGVVVRSEELHRATFLEVLAPYGIKASTGRWYHEFAGTGSRHIIKALLEENGIKADLEALVEKRKKLYETRVRKGELTETPGVREFLTLLRKRGIRTAIVSGSHSTNVSAALSFFGLKGFFDVIVSGDDLKERKPEPEPFLYAARKLNVAPADCLAIEDSVAGAEAAKAAGTRLVIVRSPASKYLYGYDAIINDFSEFPLEMLL